jgi:hypothetical protein
MAEQMLESPIGEVIPTVSFEQKLEKAHEPGSFFSTTCQACQIVESLELTNTPRVQIELLPDGTRLEYETMIPIYSFPDRCPPCDKEWSRLRRLLKLKDLVIECHQELRKPAVGFLTLNLKGWEDSYYRSAPPGELIPRIKEARSELYSRWGKFWRNYLKKHCVGAYRFFEWTERVDVVQEHLDDSDPTTIDYKLHPHLHVLVLQEGRSINISELREKAEAAGFGNQIDMNWSPSARTLGSVDYCLSYVKKDLQIDGRNRQGYGVFHGRSTSETSKVRSTSETSEHGE